MTDKELKQIDRKAGKLGMNRSEYIRHLIANCRLVHTPSIDYESYVSVDNYTDVYFPEHNIRFIAVNDGIDIEEGENEIAPFKNILNEMYTRDISKKGSFISQAERQYG